MLGIQSAWVRDSQPGNIWDSKIIYNFVMKTFLIMVNRRVINPVAIVCN
jgi:hypothetical protein